MRDIRYDLRDAGMVVDFESSTGSWIVVNEPGGYDWDHLRWGAVWADSATRETLYVAVY